MSLKRYILVLSIVLLIGCIQLGWTAEFRTGNSVSIPEGTRIADDLAASGQSVDIAGSVAGDILAAGNQINVSGSSTQSMMLAGSNVNASGSTGNDLFAAGGQINLSGPVTDNAWVAGGTIIMAKTARVGRDLQIAGGTIGINGNVGRNLNAAGGQVSIDGQIGGNANINAGNLTLGPTAVIRGDLIYSANTAAKIDPGAKILGRTVYRPAPEHERRDPSAAAKFGLWLASLLAMYVVGAIIIALTPRESPAVADRVFGSFWKSLLIGFLVLVVTPVAAAIIMATLIGIPLGLILLAMYLILVYISRIYVGLAIGRWLFGKFGRANTSLYLSLLVGLVILWILRAIPIIGGFIGFISILLGIGALLVQRYYLMRTLRTDGHV